MTELKSGKKGYQLAIRDALGFEQLTTLLEAAQQIEAQPKPTTIEWSNLQSIHYACWQVLLALRQSLEAQGHRLAFKEPSPELHDQLLRYGLWHALLQS